jgi:hypothetical protein
MISNNCIIMMGSNVAKEWVRMLTRLRVRDGERNSRPRRGLSETRGVKFKLNFIIKFNIKIIYLTKYLKILFFLFL